ncbi:hypothetical protein OBV_22870 [Oscillibacter valericigenes Sjm18-20]|nr:hypothetical protein OBV_22870 [Oscillibacter valericigenes Sjm18-20]
MDEEVQVTKKRAPNKTVEERRERIDQKIQWHEKSIESLKEQRAELGKPRLSRAEKVQKLLGDKVAAGVLSLEEAKTLGYKGA